MLKEMFLVKGAGGGAALPCGCSMAQLINSTEIMKTPMKRSAFQALAVAELDIVGMLVVGSTGTKIPPESSEAAFRHAYGFLDDNSVDEPEHGA